MTRPRCAELEHLLRELVEACEDEQTNAVPPGLYAAWRRMGAARKAARLYLGATRVCSPIREAVEIADHRGMR